MKIQLLKRPQSRQPNHNCVNSFEENVPMSHQFEEKAERVTSDLNTHQIRDAANVLRHELESDPREALALIRLANQQKDPNSPDRIVIKHDGDVVVRDERNRTEVFAGRMPNYVEGDQREFEPVRQPEVRPNNELGVGIAIGAIGGLILGHALHDDHRDHDRR
jgi:hypothetical protein